MVFREVPSTLAADNRVSNSINAPESVIATNDLSPRRGRTSVGSQSIVKVISPGPLSLGS